MSTVGHRKRHGFTLDSNFNCYTAPGKNVLYPHHYDQEMLPREVKMFFKALTQGFNFANLPSLDSCTYSHSYCPEAPSAHVKYVAHRAYCLFYKTFSHWQIIHFSGHMSSPVKFWITILCIYLP